MDNPFAFDPSVARLALTHPVHVSEDDPEGVPEQFRGGATPPTGPDDLVPATNEPTVAHCERTRPFVGGLVQLRFRVPARPGPWTPAAQVGVELMWVSVDECEGTWPDATYRGRLRNIPVSIAPDRLRLGSAVTFRVAHVVTNINAGIALTRKDAFVVIQQDSAPWLTVRYRDRWPAYPLTKKGIRAAGRDLYDRDVRDWSYSSSVDFPKDYGRDLDVRGLLESAFMARAEQFGHPCFLGSVNPGLPARSSAS